MSSEDDSINPPSATPQGAKHRGESRAEESRSPPSTFSQSADGQATLAGSVGRRVLEIPDSQDSTGATRRFDNISEIADSEESDEELACDHYSEPSQIHEEEVENIKCFCGKQIAGSNIVQCQGCSIWMHSECVNYDDNSPQGTYFACDECDPNFFIEQLDKKQGQHDPAKSEDDYTGKFRKASTAEAEEEAEDDALSAVASSGPASPEMAPKSGKRSNPKRGARPAATKEKVSKAKVSKPKVSKRKQTAVAGKGKEAVTPMPVEENPATYWSEPLRIQLELMDIETNPRISNLRRFKKAMGESGNGLTLTKIVLPTKMLGRITYIRQLLDEPVIDGRQYQVIDIARGKKAFKHIWEFLLRDVAHDGMECRFRSELIGVKLCPTKAEAERVAVHFCQFLDRLPIPIHSTMYWDPRSQFLKGITTLIKVLTIATLAMTHPNQDWSDHQTGQEHFQRNVLLYGPHHKKSGSKPSAQEPAVSSSFNAWTDTEKQGDSVATKVMIAVTLHQIRPDIQIPDLTPHQLVIGLGHRGHVSTDILLPEEVPKDLIPKYEQADKIIRQVQCDMYGVIGTLEEITAQRDRILHRFVRSDAEMSGKGSNRGSRYGPYGQRRFYRLGFSRKTILIAASRAVDATVKGKMPTIYLRSFSKTHLSYVLERMTRALYSGANIIQVFQMGHLVADYMNAGIMTSDEIKATYCRCKDDAERKSTNHVCQECFEPAGCMTMTVNDQDLWICDECHARGDAIGEFRPEFKPGDDVEFRVMRTLGCDQTISMAERKPLAQDIMAHLKSEYLQPDGKWTDIWIDAARPETSIPGVNTPFIASLEGILPMAVIDGKVVYHGHPLQCAITAVYLNRLKRQHIPAFVGLLGLSQPRPDGSLYDQDQLVDEFDHLCIVENNFKWSSKKARTSLDKELVEKLNASWKRPVADPLKDDIFLEIRTDFAVLKVPRFQQYNWWKPRNKENMAHIIEQAETTYNFTIPRGEDGAPWPFIKHHMPTNWSWVRLWNFWSGKLWRMEFKCNSKDETVDDTERLFLECSIQYIKRKGKDDFLKLGITVFHKHALLASIGHKVHGQQMITGFRKSNPTSLDDWDEEKSNILFETQSSNMAKWNHNEKDCQDILEDIAKARLTTEHFTVPNDCQRLDISAILAACESTRWSRTAVYEDTEDDAYESDNAFGSDIEEGDEDDLDLMQD